MMPFSLQMKTFKEGFDHSVASSTGRNYAYTMCCSAVKVIVLGNSLKGNCAWCAGCPQTAPGGLRVLGLK